MPSAAKLAAIVSLIVFCLAPHAPAEPTKLRAYRFGATYYISINDLAAYYNLGRDIRGVLDRAEYKTSSAQLAVQADRRDLLLNGVNHWLSTPVLATRGKLWIAELDVLKTIDPVLNPGRLRTKGQVRTVVLDPGHGGSDRGTRGRSSFEKVLTLDLAKRVQRNLEAAGLRVIPTRTTDRTLPLEDRVSFAKSKGADVFVSLHFNSGGSAEGMETYCTPPAGARPTASSRTGSNDRDAAPNNRFDDQNVWLAHCAQKSLLRATGAMDRGVRRARFYVLRNANCPAVLIEAGFLSNSSEEKRILRGEYRETLAKAIADGIVAYKKSIEAQ